MEANRLALRFRPDDRNAKWNLAMALRLLDSVSTQERRSGREMTEGAVEADVVTRSVNVPDAEEDERAEDPPSQGESETAVTFSDEAPLTPEQAAELLGRSHLDPTYAHQASSPRKPVSVWSPAFTGCSSMVASCLPD